MESLVLLVFADPVMLAFYKSSLEAAQFDVAIAATAEDGLRHAALARPHVIVIDGTAVRRRPFCRELKRDRRSRYIPVIAIGRPGRPIVQALDRSGTCNTELPIPCLPDRLIVEIDRHVARAEQARQRRGRRRIQQELS